MHYNWVRHYPLLTREQERELVQEMLAGSKRAKDKLVLHNMRFIIHTANCIHIDNKSLVEREELVQEGVIEFVRALNKYRPEHKVRVTTFCGEYVKVRMLTYLQQRSGLYRIPMHVWDDLRKIKAAVRSLVGVELPRDELYRILSSKTGLSVNKIKQVYSYTSKQYTALHLDQSIINGSNKALLEIIGTEDTQSVDDFINSLHKQVERVGGTQRQLNIIHYCIDYPDVKPADVAKVFNVTKATIYNTRRHFHTKLNA